jgi:antitoxin component YwqK of YwqJK toxin-antitoxin module
MNLKSMMLCGALLSSGQAMVASAQDGKMPQPGLISLTKIDTVKQYYATGGLESVQIYSEGKLHGDFMRYREDGKLVCHGEYQNGRLVELVTEADGKAVYQQFPMHVTPPEPVY